MASYTTLQVCTAVANYKARSDHLSSGAVEAEWQDISYWRDVQLSPKSTATTAVMAAPPAAPLLLQQLIVLVVLVLTVGMQGHQALHLLTA
jgi:hypothetical protein